MSNTETEKPVVASTAGDPKETEKKFYAWSDINHGAEVDDGGYTIKRLTVKAGDEVDKKKLDISDEDWDTLVEQKVVRKAKYPELGRYDSPKRAMIANASKAMEAALAGGE